MWYSFPLYKANFKLNEINGTIKSTERKLISYNTETGICSNRMQLSKEKSFIERVKRSQVKSKDILETPGPADQKHKTKKTINNRCLGTKDNSQKLKMYRKVCSEQKMKILNLSLSQARMRNVKQKLHFFS